MKGEKLKQIEKDLHNGLAGYDGLLASLEDALRKGLKTKKGKKGHGPAKNLPRGQD